MVKKIWQQLGARLRTVNLVDRVLFIFLFLLFGYMACRLLVDPSGETHTTDIVVRTSASAIFGYLISGPFTQQATLSTQTGALPLSAPSSSCTRTNSIQNRIGFQAPPADSSQTGSDLSPKAPAILHTNRNRLQIVAVSLMGFISFALLVLARFCPDNTMELAATMSQLRDFVSASIGFLISCSKNSV